MRWKRGRRSVNVEDRRGQKTSRPRMAIGGGTLLLVLAAAFLFGGDPAQLLELLGGGSASVGQGPRQAPAPGPRSGPPQDEHADFVSVVLADTEDTWNRLFAASGQRYAPPKLVLFTDAVQSACGFNSAAVGPFYCPADRKVYIDLGFYRDLKQRFGASGDFAEAYVIAHEIGHHIQNLLGISNEVHRRQQAVSRSQANALSVQLELQADCLAGIWGHHADDDRQILEEGDIEEGLRAAAAIGDDRIQQRTQGRVSPESWTHGSSEQRVRWFRIGLRSGEMNDCDTFSSSSL